MQNLGSYRPLHVTLVLASAVVVGCGGRPPLLARHGGAGGNGGSHSAAGDALQMGTGGKSGTGGGLGTGGASGASGGTRDAGLDGSPDGRWDLRADGGASDSGDAAADLPPDAGPARDGLTDVARDAAAEGAHDARDAADAPYAAEAKREVGIDAKVEAGGEARVPQLRLVAGRPGGYGSLDGTGAAARFKLPGSLALDGAGGLYVADASHAIRRLDLATGQVSTLVDDVSMPDSYGGTSGLVNDGAGSLYVADYSGNAIRKIVIATAAVTTLTGGLGGGYQDGTLAEARFSAPSGLAYDHAGSLFVADSDNGFIRKIDLARGTVTTLTGATFDTPTAIATDGAGALFVAEMSRYAIRKLDIATGEVSTLVGSDVSPGSEDGVGEEARFTRVAGLSTDGAGNLFAVDASVMTIRKIVIATRTVTTLAGSPGESGSNDGIGATARFAFPVGIVSDGSGSLYVADLPNQAIRKVTTATGAVTTLAGAPPAPGSNDGAAADARFNAPSGIAADGAGNLFVADQGNCTLRRIDAFSGQVSTLAGTAGHCFSTDGTGTQAGFDTPTGLALVGTDTLYVTDNSPRAIRKVLLATRDVDSLDLGEAFTITALAYDGTGILYLGNTDTLRKVDLPSGAVTTLAGRLGECQTRDGTGTDARFCGITSLALDGSGNLFLAEGSVIRKLDLGTMTVTIFAGWPGETRTNDGIGTQARFHRYLSAMVYDGAGHLLVAERYNSTIRKIDIATATVTTVIGAPMQAGVALGPLPARLNQPSDLALGPRGELYITDGNENCVLVAEF